MGKSSSNICNRLNPFNPFTYHFNLFRNNNSNLLEIMTEKQQLFVEIRDAWVKHYNSPFDFNEWLYQKHIELLKEEEFNSYQHMK